MMHFCKNLGQSFESFLGHLFYVYFCLHFNILISEMNKSIGHKNRKVIQSNVTLLCVSYEIKRSNLSRLF